MYPRLKSIKSAALLSVTISAGAIALVATLLNLRSVDASPLIAQPTEQDRIADEQQFRLAQQQAFDGLWVGTMTQIRHPSLWNLRMMISRKGNIVEGVTLKEPVGYAPSSVVYEFKGMLSNRGLTFSEVKLVERSHPNWRTCKISGYLTLTSSDSGDEMLTGDWECMSEGRRFFGEINLKRQ